MFYLERNNSGRNKEMSRHMTTGASQKTNCSDTDLPSVTIVTVVYNDVQNIEKTLLSVINQNYPRLKYIVIDGGSTDGTVDIIKKHENSIDRWISEKDRGIYDAMNKGIDLASGQYINFMNSNDLFYSSTTIYDVFQNSPKDTDFIYGSHVLRTKNEDQYVPMDQPIDKIWQGMLFCHQTLFSKTALLKQNKFCPNHKIIADYKSLFLHYIDGKTFYNSQKTIAIISSGGFSDKFLPRIFERWRFVRKHINYKADIYYFCLLSKELLIRCLPEKMSDVVLSKISGSKPVQKALNAPMATLTKKNGAPPE